jgi:hypothetical protein
MAADKLICDSAREGAVMKRAQLKTRSHEVVDEANRASGQFMPVNESAKKFKGVRQEI